MSDTVANLVLVVVQVLTFAIVARALLSWFPNVRSNALTEFLYTVTEPVLIPFRRIIPRVGMMDLSPMVAIIVLQVVGAIVASSL